jgi:hypothetical protein
VAKSGAALAQAPLDADEQFGRQSGGVASFERGEFIGQHARVTQFGERSRAVAQRQILAFVSKLADRGSHQPQPGPRLFELLSRDMHGFVEPHFSRRLVGRSIGAAPIDAIPFDIRSIDSAAIVPIDRFAVAILPRDHSFDSLARQPNMLAHHAAQSPGRRFVSTESIGHGTVPRRSAVELAACAGIAHNTIARRQRDR